MNIKNYFSFSKGEKRGVIFLLSLIVIVIVSINFIKLFKHNGINDFSKFDEEISVFEKELKAHVIKDSLSRINKNKVVLPTELFDFNPNTINDADWIKLGLKEWQIKTINNYKSKGGEFRIKSDASKIYGLADTLYKLLYPYIQLPEEKIQNSTNFNKTYTKFEKPNNSFEKKNNINKIIDINTADTTELKTLKGIGSAFSKRIIKYRESLGGFIKIEQLKEVYGITEEMYNQNKSLLSISTNHLNLININTVDLETLKKHPYIDWNLAKTIVSYRKSHGSYKDVNDIKQIHLVTDEIYTKIAPYLTVK